ncbi:MAG: hypothetical protein CMP91_04710 [Gammaproteobacteria bacterium]|nr:hypothetical protein [Gammaproteobacteria bacterium]|tara:strand:+ start:421478 stop:422023 length:546 start_codon:yes stop_codon:yes gene_type:complete
MKNLILISSLIFSPWVLADQNDPRLPALFEQLKSPDAQATRGAPVEIQIWDIWAEHPDPEINQMMILAMDEMNGNQLGLALSSFNLIIERAPDFAEAWNKRATLHWMLGNTQESLDDIIKTLELEPNHFGALSGLGMVYVELGRYNAAYDALQQALEIHPDMPGVIANLEALQRYFNNTAI